MNDEIFAAMVEQMRPEQSVLAELRTQIDAESPAGLSVGTAATGQGKLSHPRWGLALAAAVLAVALVVPALSGGWPFAPGGATVESDANTVTAADYATLYRAVSDSATKWAGTDDVVVGDSSTSRAEYGPAPTASSGKTNVQIDGIDEGDIVKSDGRVIYVATGKQVAIVAADGDQTRELGRIDTSTGGAGKPSQAQNSLQGPVVELVLRGSTLVVLVIEYRPRASALPSGFPGTRGPTYLPLDAALTKALIYDVSDPAAPRYLTSLGQSGALVTTRLAGDLLYVVTEYLIADKDSVKPDDPQTFVPVLTKDEAVSAAKPADCGIMPAPDGPRYAVVSSIDLGSRARVDTESVFGGSATVFMSVDNLYLAAGQWDASKAEAGKAGAPKDLEQVTLTQLARIAIDAGKLTLAAQGAVPGTVLNQFALDEYEGKLRVVTSIEGQSRQGRWERRAALFVLGANLKPVGSISSLVKGETVQSVRFAGPVGYVVTFKQVDPLFAIDLSDPAKPKVLSALKIPGFSTYLHPWSDGDLLGLGRSANNKGQQSGLKLAMFDVTDPLAVRESASLPVRGDDSEALTEHKAVLVDTGTGLIGFPISSWSSEELKLSYAVYRYSPGTGFTLAKKITLSSSAQSQADAVRGLLIGGHLYLASAGSVTSYRSDSFQAVVKVTLGR
ncbi:beta-propeller domain-containing protein [Propionicimonas sp.]|uniref:beta-propeller domain-containing protein n=1 Tax=Propionicimonas sp. TaxID=1955623 RepID=UPI00179DE534|nr:beta-propeller domain-containing protein [Propionicimonas sp.]MBU3976211.1 beta-propeller domain-containing protein [Actinomycetota bacterium]MBA3021023.1 hypothetical protein [Propionicimonas sp.]MBU3985606.1 beta-propeller domain-containing protein [Actinomycetota bacterium]MBU4008391.1 beta-propeller domain-containing protein [Actinomycetota bacterium]MBU4066459.1 beta-propeller domain-containing protein [Actinomycetota bacterium]